MGKMLTQASTGSKRGGCEDGAGRERSGLHLRGETCLGSEQMAGAPLPQRPPPRQTPCRGARLGLGPAITVTGAGVSSMGAACDTPPIIRTGEWNDGAEGSLAVCGLYEAGTSDASWHCLSARTSRTSALSVPTSSSLPAAVLHVEGRGISRTCVAPRATMPGITVGPLAPPRLQAPEGVQLVPPRLVQPEPTKPLAPIGVEGSIALGAAETNGACCNAAISEAAIWASTPCGLPPGPGVLKPECLGGLGGRPPRPAGPIEEPRVGLCAPLGGATSRHSSNCSLSCLSALTMPEWRPGSVSAVPSHCSRA